MPIGDNRLNPKDPPLPLIDYELPKTAVEPAVRACRLFNTMLDLIFYDVPGLVASLSDKDAPMKAQGEKPPSRIVDFDALADPEGSLLLIDVTTAPYVHRFKDVEVFLGSRHPETREVGVATITGVGSSALGSAAFAWDISTAIRKPVLAIVPGYGVADVVLQGLGGWFGFGLYNYLHAKSFVQNALANTAPKVAEIGRNLSASTPDAKTIHGGPVFRFGSGSSDVLNALLEYRDRPFELLVGHSEGALQIDNAIQPLSPGNTQGLRVVTHGLPNCAERGRRQLLPTFRAVRRLGPAQHVGKPTE